MNINEKLPWTEKYRPKTLNEIVGNDDIIERFKYIIESDYIPNLILSGPSGTGKTSSIIALTKELLGEDYKKGSLFVNAADCRGIDNIKSLIGEFSMKKINMSNKIKIIILDETDNIPEISQLILKNIIETYYENTRFFFCCNDYNNIIEQIQSRCVCLNFAILSNNDINKRLEIICDNINVNYTDNALKYINYMSNGDMRIAINNLQSVYIRYRDINEENVKNICNIIHYENIIDIINLIKNKDFIKANKLMCKIYKLGYSCDDIINMIINNIKNNNTLNIDNSMKIKYINEIGNTYIKIINGKGSLLQMSGLLSRLIDIE
jgi:replication factor C subunit 2/4